MKKYGGWDYRDYRWIAWIAGGQMAGSVGPPGPATVMVPPSHPPPKRCTVPNPIAELRRRGALPSQRGSFQLCCVRGSCCTQHVQYTSLTRVRNFQTFPLPCVAARETPIPDDLYMVTVSQRPSLLHTYIHASFRVSSSLLHKVPPPLL